MSDRIKELERLVRYHQDRYYNDQPEISDEEFDALWDELQKLDPENEVFATIGADLDSGFAKREHIIPMMSQEKASNPDQFLKWAGRINHDRYIVQYKLDGASLELQYQAGRLTAGVTRGDGMIGDDITRNVRKMRNVVQELPLPFTGAVRGEVIMEHETHRTYYSDKANCRNAANGLMKRKDGVGSEHLRVICYDAVSSDDSVAFKDELEKLAWLSRVGVDIVHYEVFTDPADIVHYRDLVAEKRDSLGFDIDGLVVKGTVIDLDDLKRARPQKQIAFKFSSEEAVTVLRDVEWSESGPLYTPVGICDPVQLAGTTVKRASLVHPELIEKMGLKIGSEVVITKRGDIIPKIERLVHTPEDALDILPPERCGSCGAEVVNEGKRVYCPNPTCPRRNFHRLRKWLTVLDVRDFGDALLEKVFNEGLVREIADLYRLTPEQLSEFEGMGPVSSNKVLSNLHAISHVPLPRFLAGFDIPGIAELKIRKMTDAGFDSLEKLQEASPEQLAQAGGIGEVTALAFRDGLTKVRDQIDRVLETGAIEISVPAVSGSEVGADDTRPLAGQSVCFTGALHSLTRSEAERLVEENGGTPKSSVSQGLTYLVTNTPDSGSSKNRKARELGVSIIDENAFLELIGDR